MTPTPSTAPTVPTQHFLTLPSELRRQIYVYLLLCPSDMIIRSLFLRAHFRTVFMSPSPAPKGLCTALLRVCHQVTTEALPVLYAGPMWRCGGRIEALVGQIGRANFGLCRRVEVDVDDLPGVVEGLVSSLKGNGGGGGWFAAVEELVVEGYRSIAFMEEGTWVVRVDAVRLCLLATKLLEVHPVLNVLMQREGWGDGGADAVDENFGRVRWRFLRCEGARRVNERVVDLPRVIELMQLLLCRDDQTLDKSSLAVSWTDSGVYKQYPYLS